MSIALDKNVQKKVKRTVFKKADEFGYMKCSRVESGRFIDSLVDDPEVGKVLNEYMSKERVRTYIKDGILNAYTKATTKKALAAFPPESVVENNYNETAVVIQKGKGKQSRLFVLRAESGNIYVVSGGTVLKWETALRNALEIIANEPKLTIKGNAPSICLMLSLTCQCLTEADKNHIITAVGVVGVKVVFCNI